MQRVLIVGMGGLGCPAVLALARAGVTHFTFADPDSVSVSNLHRQLFFTDADVGRPKVEVAARVVTEKFPRIRVDALAQAVVPAAMPTIFGEHTTVIDCTDDPATKFALSDAAVRSGTPLVYGAALEWRGLAMRIQAGGPCLRCLFETPPATAENCARAGVLGPVVGLVGVVQAQLCLTPNPTTSQASLFTLDGEALDFREVQVNRRRDCQVHGR